MRMRLLLLLSVAPLLTAAALPKAPNAAELWKANCAACHGEDGRSRTELGRRYSATDLTRDLWQSSRDDASIRTAIQLGTEGGMPPFKGKLSASEVDALVKHIRGLKAAPPAAPAH